ncbi:transposase [Singulisphaera sp. GP187]|uniref:transposase n=1 Tax=Singulisphaera sp. GP187 TaxID=1882752 RepID=UPI000940D789
MLREVGQRLGLLDVLDQAIPDPRWLPTVIHDQKSMLTQRIIILAVGYEDLNDQQTLRTDPPHRTMAQGAEQRLPSPWWFQSLGKKRGALSGHRTPDSAAWGRSPDEPNYGAG